MATEESFAHILKLLREAAQTEFYRDMRRRFASAEQWKHEEPNMLRAAAICWFAAKQAIGNDREALDKHLRANKDKFSKNDYLTFEAALKVIDKEVETQFEQQFLKEDTVAKKPTNDELFDDELDLPNEELDEDEEYVRSTTPVDEEEKLWDGDDYLGDEDSSEGDVE